MPQGLGALHNEDFFFFKITSVEMWGRHKIRWQSKINGGLKIRMNKADVDIFEIKQNKMA